MDTNTLILIIVVIVALVLVLLILKDRIFKGSVNAGPVSGSLEVGSVAKKEDVAPKPDTQNKRDNPSVQVGERGVYVGGKNTGSINTGDNNSINSGNRTANFKAGNISGSTVINSAGDVTNTSPDKPKPTNNKK